MHLNLGDKKYPVHNKFDTVFIKGEIKLICIQMHAITNYTYVCTDIAASEQWNI